MCPNGCEPHQQDEDEPDEDKLVREAREFQAMLHRTEGTIFEEEVDERWAEIKEEIRREGTYRLTQHELEIGARLR